MKSDCTFGVYITNYPRSKFSKHLHFFQLSCHHCSICATCAISGTSVSATWKYAAIIRNLLQQLSIIIWWRNILFEIILQYFRVFSMWHCHLCHLWHKWHKLKNVMTQLKKVQMLRKFGSRVIHRCRLQICSQISFNDYTFVDIRCLIFN